MSPFNDKTTATGREEPVCVCVCVCMCVCVCVCVDVCGLGVCSGSVQLHRGQEGRNGWQLHFSGCVPQHAAQDRLRDGKEWGWEVGWSATQIFPPVILIFIPLDTSVFTHLLNAADAKCTKNVHWSLSLQCCVSLLPNVGREYWNIWTVYPSADTQRHTHTHTQKSVTLALTGSEGELGGLD